MLKRICLAIICAVLIGCSSLDVKPNEYSKIATGKALIMPSKAQLEATRFKIVLFEPHDKTRHKSFPRMAVALEGAIEKHLNDSGVEIVDLSLAKELLKEINLAEMKGKASYDGPAIGHFAIKPSIYSAEISYKHSKASSYTDKEGKTHRTAASCRHTGVVKGDLKLYEIPSLRLVKAINLVGAASNSTETRNTSCPIGQGISESLLSRAAEVAINNSHRDFRNVLTPTAYVSERRKKGDEKDGRGVVVTTLGLDLGAKTGENVHIIKVEHTENQLTGKTSTMTYTVAEGKISSQIGRDYSWVIVNKGFEEIRVGHQVKTVYSCGMVEKAKKMVFFQSC